MKSSENTQVKTFLYWLLSFIYYFFDKLNKKMYQWKLFKTHKLTVPVISVGNLTLGGSGKTPFIIFLTKCLQEKKQRVAVVSRNYKAQCREIAK